MVKFKLRPKFIFHYFRNCFAQMLTKLPPVSMLNMSPVALQRKFRDIMTHTVGTKLEALNYLFVGSAERSLEGFHLPQLRREPHLVQLQRPDGQLVRRRVLADGLVALIKQLVDADQERETVI